MTTTNIQTLENKNTPVWFRTKYAFLPKVGTQPIVLPDVHKGSRAYYPPMDFQKIYREKSTGKFFKFSLVGCLYDEKRKIFYLYNSQGVVTSWDLENKTFIRELVSSRYMKKIDVLEADLSPDGRHIVFVHKHNGYISIIDTQTGKYKHIILHYRGNNTRLLLSKLQKETHLILGYENQLWVWNFADLLKGKNDGVFLQGHKNYITSFTVAQNGEKLISTDRAGRILFWDLLHLENKDVNRLHFELQQHGEPIVDCAYNENLQKLITVGNKTYIWDFSLEK